MTRRTAHTRRELAPFFEALHARHGVRTDTRRPTAPPAPPRPSQPALLAADGTPDPDLLDSDIAPTPRKARP